MRNYKKFFTPGETALFMVGLLNLKGAEKVLEPSAGNGSLVRAIRTKYPETLIISIELDSRWELQLFAAGADVVFIQDFLNYQPVELSDACVANPPFGNGTDLHAHFNKMRECVVTGGKIVILLPEDFEVVIKHKVYPWKNW